MELNGTRWNSMELDRTRWNLMELDGTRWNSMELDGTRWNPMEPDANANTMLFQWHLSTRLKIRGKRYLIRLPKSLEGAVGGQCCLGKTWIGDTILASIIVFLLTHFSKICLGTGALFHLPYHPSPPVCIHHQCNEVSQGLSSFFSFSLAKAALPTNKKLNKMHKTEQNVVQPWSKNRFI